MTRESKPSVASPNELPRALVSPAPDLDASPAPAPPRAAPPPPPPPEETFGPDQREAWRERLPASAWGEVASALSLSDEISRYVLDGEGDADALAATAERPRGARLAVWMGRPWLDLVLGLGPAAVARLLALCTDGLRATPEALSGFVATFGLDVASLFVRLPHIDDALPALLPIADVHLAERIARRWTQLGADAAANAPALAWLSAHPAHTSWAVVAAVLNGKGRRRREARAALRALVTLGLRGPIEDAAAAFGVEMAELTTEDAAPVALKPGAKPAFFRVDRVRPPMLRSGKVVPKQAIETLGALLLRPPASAGALEALDEIRAACTEESLEAFAVDVFECFRNKVTSGSTALWPAALAAFGRDAAVVALASALRDRDRGLADDRPVVTAACETLERIGSDPAIALLRALTLLPLSVLDLPSPLDPPSLRDAAEAALDRVARARGVTRTQLEDACVPRLAIDGPAKVGTTAGGRILATARFLATGDVGQLERALVERRRWSHDALRAWLTAHPPRQETASHLLWAAWDAHDAFVSPLVFVEGELRPIALAGSARTPSSTERIGLLHPLDLAPLAPEVRASLQAFAQAEKLEPAFPQLDRETFVLDDAESSARALLRFEGKKLSTRRILPRGWRAGPPTDGAVLDTFERPLPGGATAVLSHSGIDMGDAPPFSVKLGKLEIRTQAGPTPLGRVPPLAMSELIREITRFTSR